MHSEPDKTEFFARDASSVAPFAVDVERTPRELAETHVIRRRLPATQTKWVLAAAGAMAALSLVSAVALRVPPPPLRAPGQPRAPRVVAAHEAVMIPVRTAPVKDLIALDDDEAATIPVSALPALRRATSATSAAPRASHGGLLRVAPSVKGILVDGAPHRVERGVIAIACGTHTIKAPSQPARSVTVACAGMTTL